MASDELMTAVRSAVALMKAHVDCGLEAQGVATLHVLLGLYDHIYGREAVFQALRQVSEEVRRG